MAQRTEDAGALWAARPSREGKDPPNSYYAQIVERLKEAFPDSRVDRETLAQLKPFFLRAWRNGFNAKQAAAAHCACEDKRIVPSPGTRIELEKGEVRPPKDAVRGEVYEPSKLRGSASVERQKRALQVELEAALRAHGKAEAATERAKKLSGKAHENAVVSVRKHLAERKRLMESALQLGRALDKRGQDQVWTRFSAEQRKTLEGFARVTEDPEKVIVPAAEKKPRVTKPKAEKPGKPAKVKAEKKPKAEKPAKVKAEKPAKPAKVKAEKKPKAEKPGKPAKVKVEKKPAAAPTPAAEKPTPKAKKAPKMKPTPTTTPAPAAPPPGMTPEREAVLANHISSMLKGIVQQELGTKK